MLSPNIWNEKYTTEGFVVLKGSKARLESVASIQPSQSASASNWPPMASGRRIRLYPQPPVR
jgi:hypothetical protein